MKKKALVFSTDSLLLEKARKTLSAHGFESVPVSSHNEFVETYLDKEAQFDLALVAAGINQNQLLSFAKNAYKEKGEACRFILCADSKKNFNMENLRPLGLIKILDFHFTEKELDSALKHLESCVQDPFFDLMDILEGITGVQIAKEKKNLVESRLQRRVLNLNLKNLDEYISYFHSHREREIPKVISLVTTHTTEFFREDSHFEELFNRVFPEIFSRKKKIKIWSAASSTGQEVYSLAIACFEYLKKSGFTDSGYEISILGTDIDEASLATAREGIYRQDQIGNMSEQLLKEYFDRGQGDLKDYIKIKDEIHRVCHFSRVNLLADEFSFSQVDIVFLRNTLIYFTPHDVALITNKISEVLNPEGLLFLGHSESLTGLKTPYKNLGHSIYALVEKKERVAVAQKVTAVKSLRTTTDYHLQNVILIGSSTGGVEALKVVLEKIPLGSPPILIVQHIPQNFSLALAKRLNEICQIEVKEALDGEKIEASHAYIAPGGKQMRVRGTKNSLYIEITDDPPLGLHKPSVNYLFESCINLSRDHYISAAILTGMGSDGAQGLKKLRKIGAYTVAQNEETSVVFGMPGAAVALDAAIDVLPLEEIAEQLLLNSYKRAA